jgi:hypothetical protein
MAIEPYRLTHWIGWGENPWRTPEQTAREGIRTVPEDGLDGYSSISETFNEK